MSNEITYNDIVEILKKHNELIEEQNQILISIMENIKWLKQGGVM